LVPDRFDDPGAAYGYHRTLFDQVANGERPPTISIMLSSRHLGVTVRDTRRPGFEEAVRAAYEEDYPVLVRSAGGGPTAAGLGTFGFSVVRPSSTEEGRRGIRQRYDEAVAFALGALGRLGIRPEVGEVRDEFCPGDQSLRIGSWKDGMKIVGIAQRVTGRATSVGGIVLVWGEDELARVLRRVYAAMGLPLRPDSVGSIRLAGSLAGVRDAMLAFAEEAKLRYGAVRMDLDGRTLELARNRRREYLVLPPSKSEGIRPRS
jgi:lipoate-protein ligase A